MCKNNVRGEPVRGDIKIAENETKWRIGAYVEESTYEKITALQHEKKRKTGKKASQGQVLDEVFKNIKIEK